MRKFWVFSNFLGNSNFRAIARSNSIFRRNFPGWAFSAKRYVGAAADVARLRRAALLLASADLEAGAISPHPQAYGIGASKSRMCGMCGILAGGRFLNTAAQERFRIRGNAKGRPGRYFKNRCFWRTQHHTRPNITDAKPPPTHKLPKPTPSANHR